MRKRAESRFPDKILRFEHYEIFVKVKYTLKRREMCIFLPQIRTIAKSSDQHHNSSYGRPDGKRQKFRFIHDESFFNKYLKLII